MTKTAKVIAPKTAQEAAERMMVERGYVVAGFPDSDLNEFEAGEYLSEFGGKSLDDKSLLCITRKTTKKDWDTQFIALFGRTVLDKNQATAKSKFFRCSLVKR